MYAPIAQLVEQIPFKDKVVGSIPTGRTSNNFLYCFYSNFYAKIKLAKTKKYAFKKQK